MGKVVSLTGKDTHKINGRILNDFADGDCVQIEYESDLVAAKKGKNGNTIYAVNETGKMSKATYRLLVGSADDKFMNALLQTFVNDPAAFTLMTGESVKRTGDGAGAITPVTYAMTGGLIKKQPSVKDNAEGDTEQASVTWEVIFGNSQRSMG